MTELQVDPSNTGQANAWDGNEGAYWADNVERFDRAVAAHHKLLMSAAKITTDDRVLDVGCGGGQTTRDAARAASSGAALGVDLSGRMIDVARQIAVREDLANVTFQQVDAQVHAFKASEFDIVISRMGAMFFGDPIAAFSNIARALRPGGQLVLLTWQERTGNEWMVEPFTAMAVGRDFPIPPINAPGPFSLADPGQVRAVLGTGGFTDIQLEPHREPIWLGSDVDDAERFVLGLLGWMLGDLDDHDRQRALDNLRATLTAHVKGEGVLFGSATWTISATRS